MNTQTTDPIAAVVTLAVRSDCAEYLRETPGESRERNLADMLDSGQATITNIRIDDAPNQE